MNKIAIIGLGCLFPGAHNPQEFWQNLIEEVRSTSLATAKEMGVDPSLYFDPKQGTPDKSYWMHGGFVRDFTFEPAGYRLLPERLEELDQMFQWSLYVARQALQDSGYLEQEGLLERCGVILGNLSFPTHSSHRLLLPIYQEALSSYLGELLEEPGFELQALPSRGSDEAEISPDNILISGYPSAVVAQGLGLGAGHVAIDAACATSLYAVKLACHYLLSGKADLMLAGAVSGADPFFVHQGFSIFHAYPLEGEVSRPLDSSSRGLTSAEGGGMLVLKRYEDALRDGDKVYAVIRGVGLSNDGRGKHPLTPNPKGQRLVFERAYDEAGVAPQTIDYVECHATGTPLGDVTELNSMESFFGADVPLVGSVKSTFGHLLTAAGMAGIIKAVLGMEHGIIPATIRIQEPLSSQNNVVAAQQIVRSATPWAASSEDEVKRAAISAFGFGGTNAHLILESNEPLAEVAPSPTSSLADSQMSPHPLAIVGMDAFFGACEGLDAFYRTIYEGKQHFIPLPAERWKGIEQQQTILKAYGFEEGQPPQGAYIDGFEMDFLHFKNPPSPADQPIPQHLLMLKVADKALRDGGIKEGSNVAVIVAMGSELSLHQYRGRVDLTWQIKEALEREGIRLSPAQEKELEEIAKDSLHSSAKVNQYTSFIGNIIASRISAHWDLSGPSFTVSSEEQSVWGALEIAQLLLTANEVDAVLVGAIDLAGGVENVLLRHRAVAVNQGTPSMSFEHQVDGWQVGEGAGAVVLKRHDQALAEGSRIYAVIEALAIESEVISGTSGADALARASRRALKRAEVKAEEIGYLELFASGMPNEDEAEIEGLFETYLATSNEPQVALGSVKANIGHTFCASGMASLIKTALTLYHRFIPGTPGWAEPKTLARWQDSRFYVPTESRPWLAQRRLAAINGLGRDGVGAHLILSEQAVEQGLAENEGLEQGAEHRAGENPSFSLNPCSTLLFLLAAEGEEALLSELDGLEEALEGGKSLFEVAGEAFIRYRSRPEAAYVLSICGMPDELAREISLARKGVGRAFEKGKAWETPRGSYFTASPLGADADGGGIAFVYPGAFNAYIGLGQDIFNLVPSLHERLGGLTSDLGRSVGDKQLYPRRMSALSREQLQALEVELVEDAVTMLESGLTFATAYTMILRDLFKVEPSAAFGYSLGEACMMWALGIWQEGDMGSEALRSSELFTTRLAGAKKAVREHWGGEYAEGEDELPWSNYVVMASAERVLPHLAEEPHVYLTIINSPKEVVIAGDPDACQRVIKAVKTRGLRAPFDHVIHCEPMASEYDEFVRLNTLPVSETPAFPLYSAAREAYSPLTTLNEESIAHTIAGISCQPLDFPRLVRNVYDDGARIFIELGAARTCSRWVEAILKKEPHVAISINKRGVDDQTSIMRLLATLASHRVPLDLAPLYGSITNQSNDIKEKTQKQLIRRITIGGARIGDRLLTEENRQKFARREAIEPIKQAIPLAAATYQPVTPILLPAPQQVAKIMREQKTPLRNVESEARKIEAPVYETASGRPTSLDKGGEMAKEEKSETAKIVAPSDSMSYPLSPSDSMSYPSDSLSYPLAPSQTWQEVQLQLLMALQNSPRISAGHRSFLRTRHNAAQQMGGMLEMQMKLVEEAITRPLAPAAESVSNAAPTLPIADVPLRSAEEPSEGRKEESEAWAPQAMIKPKKAAIWDEAQLLEFAEGKIGNVFGKAYASIDNYHRRVRLPTPPYLLVSRVTKLDAEIGQFRPSSLTTEYDIPEDAWYLVDGQVPWAVEVESGQCDLLLISYIGIDFECKGQRIYRLLDATLTFVDEMAKAGETLRYDIKINSYARSGPSLLFFFSYDCYIGDRLVLKMRDGCAGFFSDAELEQGQGVIFTDEEKEARQKAQARYMEPLLQSSRHIFERNDLLEASAGNLAACFGAHYNQQGRNPSLRLAPPALLMLDRITTIEPHGGAWGLGFVLAEKDLAPSHWYFPCHFSDDPVLAGSLMAEGCTQLMQFFLLYLGLQTHTVDARFQPIPNLPQVVRCRGQVTPINRKLSYRMEVTDIGLEPHPYAIANVELIVDGKIVVYFRELGLQLVEKEPRSNDVRSLEPQETTSVVTTVMPKRGIFNEEDIETFATGKISGCFGPEYAIYDERRTPRTPNGPLKLVSRVVEINAQRREFKGKPSVVTEYDVPADAWYYQQNNYPTMPYSILMEIALQPSGFLSAYLGSTLPYPEIDFYFRNLDGYGHQVKPIDLRGKTISNHITLLSSTAIQGIIIQKFDYVLSCEGEPFYEGSAAFGYFTKEALANQVGLDAGKTTLPWHKQSDAGSRTRIDLHSAAAQRLYQAPSGKPHYRLAQQKLNLLDEVLIIPDGGQHEQGYVYAERLVEPENWFFKAHFYQDPVMPGSLGIEAILQAMQAYALDLGLGREMNSPHFEALGDNHKVTWKYRGQIPHRQQHMRLEVHIKRIEQSATQITLIGDASLWREELRIYHVTDIGLAIVDG